ncbi:PorP/SprF family type IX secretion system membrane protein [Chryseosolibacter indicus]|uniref:Type IX secretion system membrane protein PorP/SprF n=1 Tax=Chryseosolibacter indicus TaxID=2782351 RepID=A0ABS5VR02_9BACT|nr:type IX secretion system membrane protein PorP/SprF [Chryseosolibacter indicus]MBT1703274.1 type IX secretion system membrane protein PorP/SprF [Chryseosolibacter indicus]
MLSLKRIFLTTLLLSTILIPGIAQQYPVFSQYYFNELVINPAYAGSHVQFSTTAMYRNQWVNFPGAPKTYHLTTHTSLMKNKIGVGLMLNHDEIGSYKNEHIYGNYAYKLHFKNATLSMGLQAGFNLLGADYSKLSLQNPDGIDASFSNLINEVKPNFGAGLFYSTKNYFLGFSVPFILNNQVIKSVEELAGGIREARYYFLRGGAILPLDRMNKVKINPSVMLRTQEGQPLTFDLNNAFIFYDVFSIGWSYRLGDSFITFIDLKINDRIHFGYSYDLTTSNINGFSNGTHEFMINFRTIIRPIHGNPECPQYYNYR